jgi:hypothetical protein
VRPEEQRINKDDWLQGNESKAVFGHSSARPSRYDVIAAGVCERHLIAELESDQVACTLRSLPFIFRKRAAHVTLFCLVFVNGLTRCRLFQSGAGMFSEWIHSTFEKSVAFSNKIWPIGKPCLPGPHCTLIQRLLSLFAGVSVCHRRYVSASAQIRCPLL